MNHGFYHGFKHHSLLPGLPEASASSAAASATTQVAGAATAPYGSLGHRRSEASQRLDFMENQTPELSPTLGVQRISRTLRLCPERMAIPEFPDCCHYSWQLSRQLLYFYCLAEMIAYWWPQTGSNSQWWSSTPEQEQFHYYCWQSMIWIFQRILMIPTNDASYHQWWLIVHKWHSPRICGWSRKAIIFLLTVHGYLGCWIPAGYNPSNGYRPGKRNL